MAKKEEKKNIKLIKILPIKMKWLVINIIGISPFSCHKLSKKAKEILDPSGKGEPKIKKQTIDPQQEFARSLYWLDKKGNLMSDGKDPLKHKSGFGMKASAFKQGMIFAARYIQGLEMTTLRGVFHVFGAKDTSKMFVKIIGIPEIECEFGNEPGVWVRIGGKGPGSGTPSIRYRGTFKKWSTTIYVQYNSNWISEEQIFNLANIGGFVSGIGEDRPGKKGGTGGMYRVR